MVAIPQIGIEVLASAVTAAAILGLYLLLADDDESGCSCEQEDDNNE